MSLNASFLTMTRSPSAMRHARNGVIQKLKTLQVICFLCLCNDADTKLIIKTKDN
jgi:hypothetical protein